MLPQFSTSSLQLNLDKKIVLVTGASSGFGREIAIEFAKNGSFLGIADKNLEGLNETKVQCAKYIKDENIHVIFADLLVVSDCIKVVNETVSKFNGLDIVINNAGIARFDSIENSTIEAFEEVFNTNLRSVFVITKEAIPHLKKTKGNIINVSSVAGIRSFGGLSIYCASKAGLTQFTKCSALELGQYGIRVNSVNPGVCKTKVFENGGMETKEMEKFYEYCAELHPIGRVGTTFDVAQAIIFLSSNSASGFISGTTLSIDGGLNCSCAPLVRN